MSATPAEYLVFVEQPPSASGKTRVVSITSKSSGLELARIAWYGAWRQYVLFPSAATLFNIGCLERITAFIRDMMDSHRRERDG